MPAALAGRRFLLQPSPPRSTSLPQPHARALQGARVVVSSRRQQNVEEVVRQLRSEGLQVAGTACHVGDPAQLQALVAFAVDAFGKIDVLVSNAAVNPAAGPILGMEVGAGGGVGQLPQGRRHSWQG